MKFPLIVVSYKKLVQASNHPKICGKNKIVLRFKFDPSEHSRSWQMSVYYICHTQPSQPDPRRSTCLKVAALNRGSRPGPCVSPGREVITGPAGGFGRRPLISATRRLHPITLCPRPLLSSHCSWRCGGGGAEGGTVGRRPDFFLHGHRVGSVGRLQAAPDDDRWRTRRLLRLRRRLRRRRLADIGSRSRRRRARLSRTPGALTRAHMHGNS